MISTTNKSPKERGAMQTLYFTPDQTKRLLAISDLALIQMQHYVAIAHQTNPNMEDEVLATMLGKSEQVIKRTRLALTSAGWFLRKKHTDASGLNVAYFVGEQAVENTQGITYQTSTSKRTPEGELDII
jgi:hypothetical protein